MEEPDEPNQNNSSSSINLIHLSSWSAVEQNKILNDELDQVLQDAAAQENADVLDDLDVQQVYETIQNLDWTYSVPPAPIQPAAKAGWTSLLIAIEGRPTTAKSRVKKRAASASPSKTAASFFKNLPSNKIASSVYN